MNTDIIIDSKIIQTYFVSTKKEILNYFWMNHNALRSIVFRIPQDINCYHFHNNNGFFLN